MKYKIKKGKKKKTVPASKLKRRQLSKQLWEDRENEVKEPNWETVMMRLNELIAKQYQILKIFRETKKSSVNIYKCKKSSGKLYELERLIRARDFILRNLLIDKL